MVYYYYYVCLLKILKTKAHENLVDDNSRITPEPEQLRFSPGIFKAGMGVGVLVILGVIALFVYLFSKVRRR